MNQIHNNLLDLNLIGYNICETKMSFSILITYWITYQCVPKAKIIMYVQRRIQSNILSNERQIKYLQKMSRIVKVQIMKMWNKEERNQNLDTSRER